MANINPKLNLNKTPSIVDNNSLIFAKNIRLDVDSTIHRDYSIMPLSLRPSPIDEEKLVYYLNTVRRASFDIKHLSENTNNNEEQEDLFMFSYYISMFTDIQSLVEGGKSDYGIVGIIPDTDSFYLFINGSCSVPNEDGSEETFTHSFIIKYVESEDKFYPCNCGWKYSGGKITGCVLNNLLGEKILNVCEYSDNTLIPLKSINLSKSKLDDDDSIYTQTPNIPITNINSKGTFSYTIPNGVYQFFIRYKIRDNFYTDWFPASKEFFAGNKNNVITNFGTLNYLNTHKDSDYSFIFEIKHLFSTYNKNYDSFQIGFIVSRDDAIYARAWKHFNFVTEIIKFDYKADDAEEIEITDLTKVTYQIYNVGNVTSFKNKLYISNYTETNFNENLQTVANAIKITPINQTSSEGYDGREVISIDVGSKKYIVGIKDEESIIPFTSNIGIIDNLLKFPDSSYNYSIYDTLKRLYNNDIATYYNSQGSKYGFTAYLDGISLEAAKNIATRGIKESNGYVSGPNFVDDSVINIQLNGKSYESVEEVIEYIEDKIKYLDENAVFVDENFNICSNFKIIFLRHCTYTHKVFEPDPISPVLPDIGNGGIDGTPGGNKPDTDRPGSGINKPIDDVNNEISGGKWVDKVTTSSYEQKFELKFYADSNKLKSTDGSFLKNHTTLIPYQEYKFYVHFVKQSGEITNGYYCGGADAGIITAPYKEYCDSIIYPKFENINIPNGYVACFFSIFHCGKNVATIFNIKKGIKSSGAYVATEGSCIDLNARLISGYKDITCRQGNNVLNANYYHSADASIIRYFGADGVVVFDEHPLLNEDKLAYVVNDYESQQDKDATLVKCTPYIKDNSFDDYTNLNLGGYICQVTPLDRQVGINFYADGTSAYKKDDDSGTEDVTYFRLDELGVYSDSKPNARSFGLKKTTSINIYSNYNLNFLTITEEPKLVIKTCYTYGANENPDTTVGKSFSIIWRLLSSQLLSDIYSLPSMYVNYTRKTYLTYEKDSITRFDNTVRTSILEGDESSINIYKFGADDYYNIPTNRGIITNLIAVGDAILVHTKDSMFRFTGSNNLQSTNGEIQPNETQPFDTGVAEIFGSDFGFAGLQNKTDCIITENGYIFFDRDSKVIYMYSGQGQITKLSDSIEKLFRRNEITNVYFANDYYNNRFFVSILFADNQPVTLSFSTLDNIRNFVSLHDFYFVKAFNTKTKCYFVTLDKRDIGTIDKSRYGIYYKMNINNDSIYPSRKETESTFIYYNEEDDHRFILNFDSYNSIVDVIDNTNYEVVKTLNAINWCSRFINDEFIKMDSSKPATTKMADVKEDKMPCGAILVYSDSTLSEEIEFSQLRENDLHITNPRAYKLARFNQGKWTLNYFRDIENTKDIFNYLTDRPNNDDKPSYNDGRLGANLRSDNNSLIEGKYFVVRFYFNKEFKLETLSLNYNNKL